MAKLLVAMLVLAACSRTMPVAVTSATQPVAPAPAPVVEAEPAHDRDRDRARGRVVVTSTDIEIFDTITFVGATAQLANESTRILDAVAKTLLGNPSILLMEVRGHVDTRELSDPRARAELSIRRAQIVMAELIRRGVAQARLAAYGASDSEPLSATQWNGRIEFMILDRSQ